MSAIVEEIVEITEVASKSRVLALSEDGEARIGKAADCESLANIHDNSRLDDGRVIGSWKTRYPVAAWVQIAVELIYLCAILVISTLTILDPALSNSSIGDLTSRYITYFGSISIRPEAITWIALWVSGLVGGTVFSLKWLYHSVAKGMWSRDRALWRFVVPLNSATVALFTGFLFASGAVPFLKDESLTSPLMAVSFGFIFGYFSDHILAAMQKLAQRLFGTIGSDG